MSAAARTGFLGITRSRVSFQPGAFSAISMRLAASPPYRSVSSIRVSSETPAPGFMTLASPSPIVTATAVVIM